MVSWAPFNIVGGCAQRSEFIDIKFRLKLIKLQNINPLTTLQLYCKVLYITKQLSTTLLSAAFENDTRACKQLKRHREAPFDQSANTHRICNTHILQMHDNFLYIYFLKISQRSKDLQYSQ